MFKFQAFVETRYRGMTEKKGSRIIAKNVTSGKRITVSWDPGMGADDNFEHAARKLFAITHPNFILQGMISCSLKGGGRIFTFRTIRPKRFSLQRV